ncbi:MAG: DcaP family trimeric outer membrane transporter [Gammaproteobacteria bacterium]
MKLTAGSRFLFVALALWTLPVLAADDDLREMIKELKAQVKHLSSRVAELEEKLAQKHETGTQAARTNTESDNPKATDAPASGPQTASAAATDTAGSKPAKPEAKVATGGNRRRSYTIPATDTTLTIGGYAKLDVLYNSISAGADQTADQFLLPPAIPVGPSRSGQHGEVTFTARESRLWLRSFTPTSLGDLNTYLEMDFYAQDQIDERVGNSHSPRLRHAYGTLGHFLGGQTWTTFMNVAALPELNDFGGPVGLIVIRQPLVRWTQPVSIAELPLDVQVALESPESTLTLPNGFRLTPDDDRSPDIVARLDYIPDWGSLSIAGLARQIRISNSEQRAAAEAWGGAFSLAGKIRTAGLDNFRFMLSYGSGLGRYVSYNLFNDAALSPSGHLNLVKVFGGFAAYQHWWNPKWRSTVAYGFARADYPGFAAQSVSRQAQSVHVNLLWSPLMQTTFGLEYIYAVRELLNGQQGDLQRVQFSTRFNF